MADEPAIAIMVAMPWQVAVKLGAWIFAIFVGIAAVWYLRGQTKHSK